MIFVSTLLFASVCGRLVILIFLTWELVGSIRFVIRVRIWGLCGSVLCI